MSAAQKLAQVRCLLYLLFVGMWRGECEIRAENGECKTILIASGTGDLSRGDVKLTCIFYNPTGKTQSEVTMALNGWAWEKRR